MIIKYLKLFLVLLIMVISFSIYNVEAYDFNIDHTFGIEKKFTPQENTCSSILGDVNDENSVAWLVQRLLNYVKIIGPTVALIMGSIDFGKAIVLSDEENMKKAQGRFIKRILAALALFFVPLFVQILLGMFGITSDNASCGLK